MSIFHRRKKLVETLDDGYAVLQVSVGHPIAALIGYVTLKALAFDEDETDAKQEVEVALRHMEGQFPELPELAVRLQALVLNEEAQSIITDRLGTDE